MNDELYEKDLDNVVGGVPYDAGKEMLENGPAYDPNGPAYDPHQMTENHTDAGNKVFENGPAYDPHQMRENHTDAGVLASNDNHMTQDAGGATTVSLEKKEEDPNYLRLIAAQNETGRLFRIAHLKNQLSDQERRRRNHAIAAGICFAGLIAAGLYSGIDFEAAIQLEIKAINSFEALKEYLATFTPAMWITMTGFAINFAHSNRNRRAAQRTQRDIDVMEALAPEDYQDVVERQARSK